MIDWTFHDLAFLSALRISVVEPEMTLEEIRLIQAGIDREAERARDVLLTRKILESGDL